MKAKERSPTSDNLWNDESEWAIKPTYDIHSSIHWIVVKVNGEGCTIRDVV